MGTDPDVGMRPSDPARPDPPCVVPTRRHQGMLLSAMSAIAAGSVIAPTERALLRQVLPTDGGKPDPKRRKGEPREKKNGPFKQRKKRGSR